MHIRFNKGDRVRVLQNGPVDFVGKEGQVRLHIEHPPGHIQYSVEFHGGATSRFIGAEHLEPTHPPAEA